ncbi:hypothetical protein SSP24_84040 [Streptomyces spinoverrucosus]|uniref:Anaphase-promoting complex subunit 4 WD40 domain-containing protein n=1 Tax=Streptomyces spinoverrucosus TaxID=284043 RepID=A0A4Y3VYI0_9ACTN|nr:WD40 repeat domain-containing protein [Streptomyces spinoverrucosus]GEC10749.1 hypothetical protein SSP24_84040 [Streptomyces spinoverrucosus]GHB71234.1 hypothetical protein GCM10010397_47010 [Streptomyces spinoverrucosus]
MSWDPWLGAGHDDQPLLFLTAHDGSMIGRWDIETGQNVWRDGDGVSCCNDGVLVRLPDGIMSLVIATEDGIEWWDALRGQHRPEMTWDGWTICALTVGAMPDGRPVVFGAGQNGAVYRWNGSDGQLLGASDEKDEPCSMMAVASVPVPGGAGVIVSGDEVGQIWRWDPTSGDQVGEPIMAHASQVRIIEPLPLVGEPLFASSDQEGVLRRWSALTGAPVGPPIETGTEVYALTSARVGRWGTLFSAGADEIVRAWDAYTGEPIDFSVPGVVASALTQPDGTALLATGTAQGNVIVRVCGFDIS